MEHYTYDHILLKKKILVLKHNCIMLKLQGWIHPYNKFSPCCDLEGSDLNPCIVPKTILSFVPPLANINHIRSTCHMLWIFECHGEE